jgi:SAM-dependent methyltransferase
MSDFDYSIYYERFHPDSDEHDELMTQWLMGVLNPLIPRDKSGAIVDIGCGHGFALRALQKLGFENPLGVEVSKEQALKARSKGLNVELIEDTIEWLNARTGCFSMVLLLDVLEHVEPSKQISMLRAIYRSLTRDGRIIIQVPNATAMLSARWRYNDFTHHISFTEHSLYFVLRNAGFEDIKIGAEKGLGRFPKRLWRRDGRRAFRRYVVRWCWLQVFKAELPWEHIEDISFELNLNAVAFRRA